MVILPTLYRIFSDLLLHNWGMDIYKKESVRLAHAYYKKVVEKPERNKRCQSPHLNDMEIEYTVIQCIPCHKQTRSECHSFILRS